MASLRVPAPTPVSKSTLANRRSLHMPLSSHGMPKAPRALSPERPHRFSAIILPSPPAESSPMTPQSPGPMSPPMSAKSFGTFIDSTPSTPAYSPRHEGGEWGQSHITILRPMSSSSLPSSPTEPAWEMLTPVKQPTNATSSEDCSIAKSKLSTTIPKPLALSRPVKRSKTAASARSITSPASGVHATIAATGASNTDLAKAVQAASNEDALRQEADVQARKLVADEEASAATSQQLIDRSQPEQSLRNDTAPLGKLATRMKSLLRRNTGDRKKDKSKSKKEQQEFDRLEDEHWSEM